MYNIRVLTHDEINKMKFNYLAISIPMLLSAASIQAHGHKTIDLLMDRTSNGNITEAGGATRLKGDATDALKASITNKKVKNVILLIGDGMGDSEITIARNYAKGASGYFSGIDGLPLTGQYTHYSLNKETKLPNYVPDSAATGTAWATGVKTYNGAISVDVNDNPVQTILQLAKANGKATGNVTTSEIQDATPAVLASNVTHRKCYSPESTTKLCPDSALENGGLGSITEQFINTRADVVFGGGMASFEETAKAGQWKGKTLLDQAVARGYTVVTDTRSMNNINVASNERPVIGLFSAGNMPVRWSGDIASPNGNIDKPAQTCKINPKRTDDFPTLSAMTAKAIDLLKDNENGFFLQVEGASIDKQDHQANPCGQIGETVDLDEAVQVALEFAKTHGDTLVIVTADHAHTSQIIPNGQKATGLSSALKTVDGAIMDITYGTSEIPGSQSHTGSQVRIAAYGPHAANVVGLTDQTDLFYTMKNAMELK